MSGRLGRACLALGLAALLLAAGAARAADEPTAPPAARAQAWLEMAAAALGQGDIPRVKRNANQAIAAEPKNPWAYAYLGVAYLEEELYKLAVVQFNTALALGKDTPPQKRATWHAARGRALVEAGMLAAGLQDLEQALALAPQTARALGGVIPELKIEIGNKGPGPEAPRETDPRAGLD